LRAQRCQEYEAGDKEQCTADQAERITGADARGHEKNGGCNKQDPAPQLISMLGSL
jgi:hypothetical protein